MNAVRMAGCLVVRGEVDRWGSSLFGRQPRMPPCILSPVHPPSSNVSSDATNLNLRLHALRQTTTAAKRIIRAVGDSELRNLLRVCTTISCVGVCVSLQFGGIFAKVQRVNNVFLYWNVGPIE